MMGKNTKIWLLIAASLILTGCLIFGGVMTMLNWDFAKLSTHKYETNQYSISEKFDSISITADTADIIFLVSENDSVSVTCKEREKEKHSVFVEDGTLVIKLEDNRKWYDYISIHLGSPKITVSLPQGAYDALNISSHTGDIEIPQQFSFASADISLSTGDVNCQASTTEKLKIQTSTGDITVKNLSAGELELQVSTGRTVLTDVQCNALVSTGNTGNVCLRNVIATEKLSIERSTGDVTFDRCDAGEIVVKTDTGDITGSLLSGKIFLPESDTGKVDVPRTTTGGKCRLSTNTGDIKISIP